MPRKKPSLVFGVIWGSEATIEDHLKEIDGGGTDGTTWNIDAYHRNYSGVRFHGTGRNKFRELIRDEKVRQGKRYATAAKKGSGV